MIQTIKRNNEIMVEQTIKTIIIMPELTIKSMRYFMCKPHLKDSPHMSRPLPLLLFRLFLFPLLILYNNRCFNWICGATIIAPDTNKTQELSGAIGAMAGTSDGNLTSNTTFRIFSHLVKCLKGAI